MAENHNHADTNPIIIDVLNDILDWLATEEIVSSRNLESIENESEIPNRGIPIEEAITQTHQESSNIINNELSQHKCTVKDMLTEILDCTVVRKSLCQKCTTEGKPGVSTENLNILYVTEQTETRESTCGMPHSTIKDIIGEILDYTVCRKTSPNTSTCQAVAPSNSEFGEPGTSGYNRQFHVSKSELGINNKQCHIHRTIVPGIINSADAVHDEAYLKANCTFKSVSNLLPSYSTVLKMGPPPRMRSHESSISFIPRIPPPSYADVEGLWDNSASIISSESMMFGPNPMYIICPRCRSMVLTSIERQRSKVAHLVALILCLLVCWPCCLLPYFLESFKYTYHTCSNCNYYLGMYRPF